MYRTEAAQNAKKYPIAGPTTGNITPCAFWERPSEDPVAIDRPDASGFLLVNGSGDTATPLEGARATQKRLGTTARLVVAEGSWLHGLYPTDCVTSTVNNYLLNEKLPTTDTSCKTTSKP